MTVFVKPSSNSINPSILEETIKELAPFRQRHLFLIVEEDFDMNAYQDVQQDFFILEQRNKVGTYRHLDPKLCQSTINSYLLKYFGTA